MPKRSATIFVVILALLAGCKPAVQKNQDKPLVTVTILPYKYFVEQLAGDHFSVNVMVPPGANHHAYDPTPRQLQDLEASSTLFINGHLGFEQTWLPGIRTNHPDLNIIDLSGGANLITIEDSEGSHDHAAHEDGEDTHSHEGPDPHYWLSVREAKGISAIIAKALIQASPSIEPLIRENLQKMTRTLDSLDQVFSSELNGLMHKSFIIFHPALNYLARDYGLTQYSMEAGGKEPAASHFRELVDLSKTENINTVFIQKEYDKENAETLAREIGARIVVIDPMSGDWLNEMKRIVSELASMDKSKSE
jgi:zinc transport system substrate-binding protein